MGRTKSSSKANAKPSKKRKHNCDSDSDWIDEYGKKNVPKAKSSKRKNPSRDHSGVAQRKARKPKKSESLDKGASKKTTFGGSKDYPKPKNCHWLPCTNNARSDSKYCSDNCGINVATLRLKHILPERLQNWNKSPSIADKKAREELIVIQKRKTDAQQQLESLEKKRTDLEQFIEAVSLLEYNPEAHKNQQRFNKEGVAFCVICANEISTKNYIKHVEKCYNKCESQMTFVSKIPTMVPYGGNPICDFFVAETRLYCKRLKVLCPERAHQQAATIKTLTAICGAPMAENPYELDVNKVCRILKKDCNQHRFWEKYRRAEIDVQKVSAWLEFELMCEKERSCLTNIEERGGGVLGLLLHHTTYHEPSKDVEEGRMELNERKLFQTKVLVEKGSSSPT